MSYQDKSEVNEKESLMCDEKEKSLDENFPNTVAIATLAKDEMSNSKLLMSIG